MTPEQFAEKFNTLAEEMGFLPEERQPLADHGWRVDYDRLGICDATAFVPLEELRKIVEALGAYPRPERKPGDLLREITAERREEIASQPLEDLLASDALDALARGDVTQEHVELLREAIRDGITGPKCERLLPIEDLEKALDALDAHKDNTLWFAIHKYRREHPGASFEECCKA
jgi:hypothetical protein